MRKPPDIPVDDERDYSSIDMSSLTYLGLWGGAAAAALLMVASATMSETGQRRLAEIFGGGTLAPQASASEQRRTSAGDAEIDNRRLADQVRNLGEDRDRLLARVTVLERNYQDATGSTGRSAAKSPGPSSEILSQGPNAGVAPALPAQAPDSIEGLLARTEIGVDLGGASSVAALRSAWDRIRRSHAVDLAGLRPVIGIREGQTGQIELRLVIGPIRDADMATKLCVTLANAGLTCRPAAFDGQRLALR